MRAETKEDFDNDDLIGGVSQYDDCGIPSDYYTMGDMLDSSHIFGI